FRNNHKVLGNATHALFGKPPYPFNGYTSRAFGIHSPCRHGYVMLPRTRNAPGAELVSFHPTGTAIPVLWMYTHFRIVHPGGGAQPSVIVQVFGNGHFWRKRPRRLPANADILRV